MPDSKGQELLRQLAAAKLMFQARAIVTAMGLPASAVKMEEQKPKGNL